jgi:hypothetical protein
MDGTSSALCCDLRWKPGRSPGCRQSNWIHAEDDKLSATAAPVEPLIGRCAAIELASDRRFDGRLCLSARTGLRLEQESRGYFNRLRAAATSIG